MPWGNLTQADLFALETMNGPGLDSHLIAATNVGNWVSAAHANGVQAFITIGGSSDQNWENACNDSNRAAFVQNLINYAQNNHFDGIDLDIEDNLWSSQSAPVAAMTKCIQDIAVPAHLANLLISADVVTNWQGPWFAPSQSYVDQYNLMTYGDSLAQLDADVNTTVNQGLPKSKFTVGLDSIDSAPPSDCGPYGSYASTNGLRGAFVFATSSDSASSSRTHTCLSQLHP